MGNIFCDYDFDYDFDFSNDQIAIQSVGTPIPNTVIQDLMEQWEKIRNHLDETCLGKKITKKDLKIRLEFYILSKKVFNQNGFYFPFKKVALRVVKRYKFMILNEKKKKGTLTSDDLTSLKAISLELQNEIKEIRDRHYEIELALLELEIELELEQKSSLPKP